MRNPIKEALHRGERVLGTMISAVTWTGLAEILGRDGWPFVVIDTEHSRIGPEALEAMIRALHQAGVVPLVRPTDADYHLIARSLDLGAMGVMVPHVDTVEEARAVAKATHYPPGGHRGVGCFGITTSELSLREYVQAANRAILTAVMIESRQAVDAADDIAAVEGIDVLVVGPADLSTEMGLPWELDAPAFVTAVERVIAAAEGAGKAAGIHLPEPQLLAHWARRGMRYLTCGTDMTMLAAESRRAISELRRLLEPGDATHEG